MYQNPSGKFAIPGGWRLLRFFWTPYNIIIVHFITFIKINFQWAKEIQHILTYSMPLSYIGFQKISLKGIARVVHRENLDTE